MSRLSIKLLICGTELESSSCLPSSENSSGRKELLCWRKCSDPLPQEPLQPLSPPLNARRRSARKRLKVSRDPAGAGGSAGSERGACNSSRAGPGRKKWTQVLTVLQLVPQLLFKPYNFEFMVLTLK